jgi:hypothetical protein
MNLLRSNHASGSHKIPPRGPLEHQIAAPPSNALNNSKNLQASGTQNARKETKYMEISFSNDNNSNNEGEATKKVELPE